MRKKSESLNLIKKAQKESTLFRAISELLTKTSIEDPMVSGLTLTKVEMSRDGSVCHPYIWAPENDSEFQEKFDRLKLYKPSLRKALAVSLNARYTPEIIFKYDDKYSKQMKVEGLLEAIKQEEHSTED